MKRLTMYFFICVSIIFTQSTIAESYWGVKGINTKIDSPAYSDAFNVGIFVGADFAQVGSNPVALEGEITTTLIPGEVSNIDWDIDTFALYAAMRTGNENFLKVKAGYLSSTVNFEGGSSTTDLSGLTFGFGVGFSGYIVEYTITDIKDSSDTLNMLSFGYMF